MEELIPKRKKRRNHKITLQLPFPINLNNGQSSSHPPNFMALGKYNGYSVVVENSVHIAALYKNGFYGKGLLSRSAPRIIRNEDPSFRYIRNRQYNCRLYWKDSSSSSTLKHKLEEVSRNVHQAMTSAGLLNESIEAFLEDSDSEDEVELITVVPDSETDNDEETETIEFVQKPDPYPTTEPLYLLLEEAFFMMYGLCCLRITDLNKQNLSIKDAWDCFRSGNDDFIHRYAVYHYFRSKGWVVKSGLKFGGDFLLYKDGPPFYHATYVVFLEVFYGLQRIESACTCNFTALNMLAANRCVETSAKGVLIAQLEYPENFEDNINQYTYEDIKNTVTVQEVLYLRWLPKKLASK